MSDARQVLAHAAIALARYAKEARHDGVRLPTELMTLADFLTDCAKQQGMTSPLEAPDAVATPLLLSKREAGAMLRVSVRQVERLISSGSLPAVKVGSSTRIRRSDLDGYVTDLPSTMDPGQAIRLA